MGRTSLILKGNWIRTSLEPLRWIRIPNVCFMLSLPAFLKVRWANQAHHRSWSDAIFGVSWHLIGVVPKMTSDYSDYRVDDLFRPTRIFSNRFFWQLTLQLENCDQQEKTWKTCDQFTWVVFLQKGGPKVGKDVISLLTSMMMEPSTSRRNFVFQLLKCYSLVNSEKNTRKCIHDDPLYHISIYPYMLVSCFIKAVGYPAG